MTEAGRRDEGEGRRRKEGGGGRRRKEEQHGAFSMRWPQVSFTLPVQSGAALSETRPSTGGVISSEGEWEGTLSTPPRQASLIIY